MVECKCCVYFYYCVNTMIWMGQWWGEELFNLIIVMPWFRLRGGGQWGEVFCLI